MVNGNIAIVNISERPNTTGSPDPDGAQATFPNVIDDVLVTLVSSLNSSGAPIDSAFGGLLSGGLTASIANGALNWEFSLQDQLFDYLAAGETLTLLFELTGLFGLRQVIVIITGTNDAPIVATADVTGGVIELVTPVGISPTAGPSPLRTST